MKPYEFMRFYHPKLGRFVYKHKGSGIIVDNIFKPMKSVVSSIFKKFAKPVAKKALESGISHTGERLGKKMSEKSGDLIMKKLAKARATPTMKFVKNLLEYSDDFSRSVAKNSLWYLDTDATTANTNIGYEARRLLTKAARDDALNVGRDVNVLIPLNRWSFFEELNDKMLVPMQLQFNIELNSDDEMVHKAQAADAARVVINRFILWVPRLTPRDSMYDKFVSSFLKETQWKYMREMYNVSAPTNTSGFFQISSSIDNVKHIFVYLKNSYRDANDHRQAEMSPYTMNTFSLPGGASLNNCRLEYGNGVFYPETEYDSESKVRIFNDVMAYAMRKNDYNTGTQLNTANYNSLYPLIYFDLTYQSEKVTRDPKQLIFRYRLSANANQNFAVHAVVLYEEILKIDKIGNELVIV